MLQRRTADNGVVYYASPLLAEAKVVHGFSTRVGGVSRDEFESLNLGNPNGQPKQDDLANIAGNYAKLQHAIGAENLRRCWIHQVHGRLMHRVHSAPTFDVNLKGDGLFSDDPTAVLSVRVADCVPVLLATADGRAVAAVHSGWRGVVANIVEAAVQSLRQLHPDADTPILAAIGPCIGFESFEVGPEVLEQFRLLPGAEATIRTRDDGKGYVDLPGAISIQLQQAGLSLEQIDRTDRCTFRDADEFFSHRRTGGLTGRMAALVAPRQPL